MKTVTLDIANRMIEAALSKGRELGLKPLSVAVLDAGGHLIAFQKQDGSSMLRFEIAFGKAYGGLAVGSGSRWLNAAAAERIHFVQALSGISGGKIVPVPGGVLISGEAGETLGAVGISGDTSDNDEICAAHAVRQVGLVADRG